MAVLSRNYYAKSTSPGLVALFPCCAITSSIGNSTMSVAKSSVFKDQSWLKLAWKYLISVSPSKLYYVIYSWKCTLYHELLQLSKKKTLKIILHMTQSLLSLSVLQSFFFWRNYLERSVKTDQMKQSFQDGQAVGGY